MCSACCHAILHNPRNHKVLTWSGMQVTPAVGIDNPSGDISPHQGAASLSMDEEERSIEL